MYLSIPQIWVYNGDVSTAMKDCWLFPGIFGISFPKEVYKKFISIADNAVVDAALFLKGCVGGFRTRSGPKEVITFYTAWSLGNT